MCADTHYINGRSKLLQEKEMQLRRRMRDPRYEYKINNDHLEINLGLYIKKSGYRETIYVQDKYNV